MENNNVFDGKDKINNESITNTTQTTDSNRVNSAPINQQENNAAMTNNSINAQIYTQNNGVVQSNTNESGVGDFVQSTSSNTQQQMGYLNQTPIDSKVIDEEELLREFVGKNYEKITTRKFNFAGFFFTTLYMFYRKMFLYGIVLFLVNLVVLNVINNFIVTVLFNVIVGLFVNKVYLYYAKKKIAKIKMKYPQLSSEDLKGLCYLKGGRSIGRIFLGLLVELGIALGVLIVMVIIGIGGMFGSLFNPDNWEITTNGNDMNIHDNINVDNNINNDVIPEVNDNTNPETNNNTDTELNNSNANTNNNTNPVQNNVNSGNNNTNNNVSPSTPINGTTLVEDVDINGYSCIYSQCFIPIRKGNAETNYRFDADNVELFKMLDDYSDYIRVDIYCIQEGSEKSIVDYKIYLNSNNKEITNVRTEDELRTKIGLYATGTHTVLLTLYEIGTTGMGVNSDTGYTYKNFIFIDKNNYKHEMEYINPSDTLNLIEGNKYNVTFEVKKNTFGYDYYIKAIN